MKTVIVTGASRGIGLAVCRSFIQEGWKVYALYSGHTSSPKCQQELVDLGAIPLICDVSDEDSVVSAFGLILSENERIDCLVNNAGVSYVGLLQDMSTSDWDHVIDVNLKGTFLCTRSVLKNMLHHHQGSIINISSMWGTYGASTEAAYSASKGGVNAFTKALAREVAPSGIRVNAVALGAMDTQMNSFLSADEKAMLEDSIGMGRMGRPEEAADLILYLAGEHSSYLTGDVIALDGAY